MALFYQRKWLLIRLPIAVVATAVAAWLWLMVYPMPPGTLKITTAGEGGAYHKLAQSYAAAFAAHGVTLEIALSEGSERNLERLRDPEDVSDLAFVQGGFGYLGTSSDTRDLRRVQTLANVDTEGVWIFSRIKDINSLNQLKGLRVAVGPAGSGSRKVALKLLEQARIDSRELNFSPLMSLDSVKALQQGSVDVVIFVAPTSSATLKSMLAVPGIQLASLQKTAAIVERNPYLEPTLLAQGALDARTPNKDIVLLTTSASLVARDSLDPALKRLASAVAAEVSSGSSLLVKAGDYPSLRRVDFPVAIEARDTLQKGLPLFERTLPFWWAQLTQRILFICLPIALAALLLMRQIPLILRWTIESRVNRWYGELKFIENDLSQRALTGLDLTRFLKSLNDLDSALRAFRCPKDLMPRCYMLHQHVEFVRQRVYRMRGR